VQPHPLNLLLEQAFNTLLLSPDQQTPSPFFKHCQQLDTAAKRIYLALPEEMSARAFEKVIQKQPLKNNFLVAGTQASQAAKLGIYPDDNTTSQLSGLWLQYFSIIGKSMKTS
jgi:hypothetical protein